MGEHGERQVPEGASGVGLSHLGKARGEVDEPSAAPCGAGPIQVRQAYLLALMAVWPGGSIEAIGRG
ncbi:MAG: hypothetical protein ACJ77L_08615, partial [Solirubrobacteraceae bacterium]